MAEPAQVQGLPKLLSYNAFLITASLFVGLSVLEGILDKNALTIALLLLLAIGLLVSSADFFIAGARSLAKRRCRRGRHWADGGFHRDLAPGNFGHGLRRHDIPTSSGDVADLAVGSIGSVLVQITLIWASLRSVDPFASGNGFAVTGC